MANNLSKKLNRAFAIKAQLKALEETFNALNEELKSMALREGVVEGENHILENENVRFCLSATNKVADKAVSYLEEIGRDDLVIIKKTTTVSNLQKILSTEDLARKQLVIKVFSGRYTAK